MKVQTMKCLGCDNMVKVRKDLTGMSFGFLTVLYQDEDFITQKGKHLAKWVCQCKCDNIISVLGSSLRYGTTKSCGCYLSQFNKTKLNDLSGRKFGRLMVIERVDNDKKGTFWLCKCDCGNTTIVSASNLKRGHVQSCGCYASEQRIEFNKTKLKKKNPSVVLGDYVVMYTFKQEEIYVDLEDYNKVEDICWHIAPNGYVHGNDNGKDVSLHCVVMNEPQGVMIDHCGGHTTRADNRKSNLRIATSSENQMNKRIQSNNTSGCTGVSFIKRTSMWRASISVNHKRIYLGYYSNFDDAVKARKEAEEKYFGEWSYENSQKYYKEHDSTEVVEKNIMGIFGE